MPRRPRFDENGWRDVAVLLLLVDVARLLFKVGRALRAVDDALVDLGD